MKDPQLSDLIHIIYNKDLRDIPISEISKYNFAFLKHDIPRNPIKDVYILNNHHYKAVLKLPDISTAQFFDFRNYANKNDYVGVLSCCLIPDGYEYNDGYSIDDVKSDIESMPITDAQTISFFFEIQSLILYRSILQSSASKQMDPHMKKILKQLRDLDLHNMIFSH